jgi:hypothetical protein
MTIKHALQQIAAGIYGPRAAGIVADRCRTAGLDYKQTATLAAKHGIDGPSWEALLYEADQDSEES